MAWSGGTFSRVHDWTSDEASAIDIEASRMDQEDDNFETGINNCLTKDGQNSPTADLPMGGNRHTSVGNANARDSYASAADVIDQDLVYYVDSGTADTYVITPSPAITAYEEGQKFVFRATNANTGASTLNVNSLGATAIQTNDGSALSAGMIVDGGYYEVVYDANPGTDRFVLVSPHSLATQTTLTPTNGNFIVGNGSDWVAESGSTARTSLGLGSLSTQSSVNDSDWSGTDLAVTNGGTGSSTASGARSNLGLGSLATQSSVNDSDWSGTDLAVGNGGTGSSTASGARSNLGLGSLATQNSVNNSDWSGTDLAVGNGGTGASNASGARSNLGIGSMAERDVTIQNGGSPSGGSNGDIYLIY